VSFHTQFEIELPKWLESFLEDWPDPLTTAEQRMLLAVELSAENVRHNTGGPFGAIVIEDQSGHLLGAGVNLVTTLELSIAHAEMVALSMAQSAMNNWNLGARTDVQLVTSCEPCAMCFGAVPWSGVTSLVWGASKEAAEAAGFDEGDKPDNWVQTLNKRGIQTRGDVLREEAAAVLARYASKAGQIYHPGRENNEL
jgi:tRNA(Arg) A34 adenosine deaminase TadA